MATSFTPKVYDFANKSGTSPNRLLNSASLAYSLPGGLYIVDQGGALTTAQIIAALNSARLSDLSAKVAVTEITATTV